MASLLDRVRRYAAQHALWSTTTRVVAAVSGGSDSVALFCLLRELAARGDLALAGLAHLNHHIRGAAADDEAAFCRTLAERASVAAFIGDADVPAIVARDGKSIEVAGREARQAFFGAACAALNAERIALAHTRNDQAETVLLRLVRGAGPTGLAGISPLRDRRVRPLLEITRAELRAYLDSVGQAWREDATNDDRDNPRNRIRHEILPQLRTFNPQVDMALARTADILRNDAEWFDTQANDAASRLVTVEPGTVRIDAAGLTALPVALARRVGLKALETANPGRSYGLEEAILLCDTAAGGGNCSLPGISMERSGGAVVLVNRGAGVPGARVLGAGVPGAGVPSARVPGAAFELSLSVPGEVHEPLGGWTVTAEGPLDLRNIPTGPASNQEQVVIEAGRVGSGLVVRQRRPGDRMRPLGAPGRKKLQDVFVDRKVPRDERDRVPIITDSTGEIVWVAGHVLSESFRVTPLTTTVVVLTLRGAGSAWRPF